MTSKGRLTAQFGWDRVWIRVLTEINLIGSILMTGKADFVPHGLEIIKTFMTTHLNKLTIGIHSLALGSSRHLAKPPSGK